MRLDARCCARALALMALPPPQIPLLQAGLFLNRPNRNPMEEVVLFQSLQEACDWALLSPTFEEVRSPTP